MNKFQVQEKSSSVSFESTNVPFPPFGHNNNFPLLKHVCQQVQYQKNLLTKFAEKLKCVDFGRKYGTLPHFAQIKNFS